MRLSVQVYAVVTICLFASRALSIEPTSSIPMSFYSQLATNTQFAKGKISFTLGEGITTTRIPGTLDIKWIVRRGIIATADFEYADDQWKALRISFSDWIEASFREGRADAHRQKISLIEFRKNGQPNEYYDDVQAPIGNALSAFPEVLTHLRISNGPSSLLIGNLFAGLDQSPSDAAHGLSPAKVEVRSESNVPGVTIVVKPKTLLPLSPGALSQDNAGSWFRVGTPTTLPLSSLSFSPSDANLKLRIGATNVQLSSGRLGLGATVLIMVDGTKMSFAAIDCDTSNRTAAIAAQGGTLSGRLGTGSQFELSQNALGSTLVKPQPTAEAKVERFSLSIQGNGLGTLSTENSVIPMSGQSANIVFDHLNAIALMFDPAQSTTLFLDRGVWTEAKLPDIRGKLSGFSAVVTGGVIGIDRSRLRILRGSLTSKGLDIGAQNSNTVTGVLQQVLLKLDSNSLVDAGIGATFRLDAGNVSVGGTDLSLTFDSALDGPTGTLSIKDAAIVNGVLKLGNQALLGISSDHTTFTAVRARAATSWTMTGTLNTGTGSFLVDTVGVFAIRGGVLDVNDVILSDAGAIGGGISSIDLAIAPQTITYSDKLAVVAVGSSRLQLVPGTSAGVSANGDIAGALLLLVPISSGTIRFGSVGTLAMRGGTIKFGVKKATGVPIELTLGLDVQVASGSLRLLPNSEILLGEGTVKALAMVGSESAGFVGPMAQVDLAINSASFSLPKGFQITTKAGRFLAGSEASPLRVSQDGLSVAGRFSIKTALDRLQNSSSSAFTVVGGDLDLELEELENRDLVTQSGPASFLHNSNIRFQSAKGDSVNLLLNLENISLTAPFNQAAAFVSDLRGRFDQFTLNIKTDPQEGYTEEDGSRHDNARFFSLTLGASLDSTQPSVLTVDRFTLIGGGPVPPLKPTVHLLLTIPPGDGEHPNSSIHEAGNHGGPDRMNNAQEAFTDTYPACRIHLYLFQGQYNVDADLDLSNVWNGGKVAVTNIHLTPPITRNQDSSNQGWDRDGCDSFLFKAVVVGFASLIGSAIAGPVGGLALGSLAISLENFAGDRLDNWINAQLASRIQSLQFSQ